MTTEMFTEYDLDYILDEIEKNCEWYKDNYQEVSEIDYAYSD